MVSSIVLGATGILGREIVKAVAADRDQWGTVYALSRKQKDEYPSHVVHRHINLLNSAGDMAADLRDVRGEYVFFAAYLEQDDEEKAWEVNGNMLQNFLDALAMTGAVSQVKRIVLVTGAKHYGVHLGQVKNPMVETDPRVEATSGDKKSIWPPNFYYRQQDIIKSFCQKFQVEWVVTYPNDVIGFAKGNFMNLAASIGIYAAVCKELGSQGGHNDTEKAFLEWPGSELFYTRFDTFTSSKLHAQFCLWAAREPRAAYQAFNVVDGDVQSWQDLWPRVARRFGMRVRPDQFLSPPQFPDLSSSVELGPPPPVNLVADEIGLRGKIPKRNKLEQRVNLARWSKLDRVREAWDRLAEREGLDKDALDKATWAFCDFVLGRDYDLVINMSKAREMGWTGYRDTWKALSDVFGELEAANVLPKIHPTPA